MSQTLFTKSRLFCPGPTPVPKHASMAAFDTDVYHRSQGFKDEIIKARHGLQPFFDSPEPPLILSSSGSGAMEAAVVNLTSEGDKVIVINGGKFGERWLKICERYLCQVLELKVPWGETVDLNSLRDLLLQHQDVKAVFVQANETSTGVAHPVNDIGPLIRESSQGLFVVDGISALVAHRISMTSANIDCLVSGSQKGFGIPPGLSFIGLSSRAWEHISQRPKFYFDLATERLGQEKGETAWTPATTLIQSLNVTLKQLSSIGVEACATHHKVAAGACRAAAHALNLDLYSKSHHSQALTAIKVPQDLDGSALVKHARDKYGVTFAGGQDEAKGRIIRLAHLGFFDYLDVLAAIGALEFCLADLGYQFQLGSGVSAAMSYFREHGP